MLSKDFVTIKAKEFLTRKYVQRADPRQKEMGLSYTTAETDDLAAAMAAFTLQMMSEIKNRGQ